MKKHTTLTVALFVVGAAFTATAFADDDARKALREQFAKVDKNNDGVLEGDELPNRDPWLNRFDRDGNDEIKRDEFVTVMMRPKGLQRLLVVRDARARAADALRSFDADKNGTIASDEYPGGRNVFRRADRNKNSELEWKELLSLAKAELDDLQKAMKRPTRYQFLNLFDLNRDRQVTKAEYDGPMRAFEKYDENDDGTVGYYEIYPDLRPVEETQAPEEKSFNVLKAMDKNDDGKVARDEWKGTVAAWKRLDRNSDGWITIADAR